MARILRTNYLTQAKNKRYGEKNWEATYWVLRLAFGVGQEIDSLHLNVLEGFKQIEISKVNDN